MWLPSGVCIRYSKPGRFGKQAMVANIPWWVWVPLEKKRSNSRPSFDSLSRYGVMLPGAPSAPTE
ncbi:hypothetical protein D3C84_797730 [compost metagenome]